MEPVGGGVGVGEGVEGGGMGGSGEGKIRNGMELLIM